MNLPNLFKKINCNFNGHNYGWTKHVVKTRSEIPDEFDQYQVVVHRCLRCWKIGPKGVVRLRQLK